jgi:hypothetical protein
MINKTLEPYRHGDLSFKPLINLPDDIKLGVEVKSCVLAEGETTGHKHVLTAELQTIVKIHTDSQGRTYIEVKDGNTKVTHEEHREITLIPGLYQMNNEREHDYFQEEVRIVRD